MEERASFPTPTTHFGPLRRAAIGSADGKGARDGIVEGTRGRVIQTAGHDAVAQRAVEAGVNTDAADDGALGVVAAYLIGARAVSTTG